MVLAAGLGTRLRPLTDDRPKALVAVGGRPMIEYPLRMLAAAGVERVVVNLHHFGDRIRETLEDGSRFGLGIEYSPEKTILDTGGALLQARPLLEGASFFLANCDALLDVDLEAVWAFHAERGAVATLVLRHDADAERYGPIDVDADGRIRRFLDQPPTYEEPLERLMFCGVHVISREIFAHMPAGGAFSITRDVYGRAHREGAALYGFRYDGYWRDLGTPENIEQASRDVDGGRFVPSYVPLRKNRKNN